MSVEHDYGHHVPGVTRRCDDCDDIAVLGYSRRIGRPATSTPDSVLRSPFVLLLIGAGSGFMVGFVAGQIVDLARLVLG